MSPTSWSRSAAAMIVGAVASLCAAQAVAGPVLDRIRSTGTIHIAHRDSSVPFSYLDANGKPIGYAMDVCQQLSEAVRKKLDLKTLKTVYVPATAANRMQLVMEGKADLECGSTTNNAERRKTVAFTIPHYLTGARYLVRADSKIDDLPQFEGKVLVSTKGTTPFKAIDAANKERLLRITVREAADHAAAMEMVVNGQADGFAMDDVLLYGLIASSANPAGLKVVGKFLTIEPLAIMLSKDDADFKRLIDDEMKRLIQSREIYPVYERWFQRPIPPRNASLNLPMSYLLKDFWKYPTDQVPF